MKSIQYLMVSGLVTTGMILGVVHTAAADRAGGSTLQRQSGPIVPMQGMPDLIVESASASVKCGVKGTRNVTAFANLRNKGAATADLSKDPFKTIVEASLWWPHGSGQKSVVHTNPQWGGPKELKPGESIATNLTFTGIEYPVYGQLDPNANQTNLGIKIVADPKNLVNEGAREVNNTKFVYVTVKKSDCPN